MSRKNGLQALRHCNTRIKAGTYQGARIWNAMRMLRRFTAGDVCAVVETAALGTVQAYARRLATTGFLRVTRAGHNDVPSYFLIRDSGPLAPSITRARKAVYDHNTQTEYLIHADA